jgi:NADH-quinone oxidoreductase subunit J
MTILDLILLGLLVLAALWAVMSVRLMTSVIALAAASVAVSLLMFRLDAPVAAMFELSVCAGLISVIFFVAISFTKRLTAEDIRAQRKERLRKTVWLPFLLAGLAILLVARLKSPGIVPAPVPGGDVQTLLWGSRHLDLVGQIVVLLAGAFGVVVLFKEHQK